MTEKLPDWAMEAAASLRSAVVWQSNSANVIVSRALLDAEQRGMECAATIAQCDCVDVCGESPDYQNVCANEIAARIRAARDGK